MGLSSPKLLVEVLRGKRALKLKDLNFVLKGLELSPGETRYLEALILWENARSVIEKNVLQSALDSMARDLSTESSAENQKTKFEAEDDELFSHWVDAALISALRLKSARDDADIVRDNLLWEEDSRQIEKSLERVRRLGVVERDSRNELKPKYDSVTTKSDRSHRGARAYFSQINAIATRALELPLDEREFQCFSIPIRQADVPAFKQLIRRFRNEVSSLSAEDGDTVYQFNLEMFPLLKRIESARAPRADGDDLSARTTS